MKTQFIIAYRNVLRHFRQSTAAVVSVSAAFFAIVIFEGYISDIKALYLTSYENRGMLGDFIIENQEIHSKEGKRDPSKFWMTHEQQLFISQNFIKPNQSKFTAFSSNLHFQGLITNGKNSTIFLGKAFDLVEGAKIRGEIWEWNTLNGKPLHLITNPGILLGRGLGRVLNCEPQGSEIKTNPNGTYPKEERPFHCDRTQVQLSTITENGNLNSLDLPVSGLVDGGYKDLDTRHVEMSLNSGQQILNTDKVTFNSVLVSDKKFVDFLIQDFERVVSAKYPQLRAIRWQDHPAGELYRKTMELFSLFRNFVIIVIITVTSLSVTNTFVKIVKERTREIGTLQSIGFSAAWLQILFVIEAIILSGFGIFFGGITALIVGFVINISPIYYKGGMLSQAVRLQIGFSAEVVLMSIIGLLTIAGVSAWISCKNRTSRKVVSNLIHV